MTTPAFTAPNNGAPTDLDAVQTADDVNQLLGEHPWTALYGGAQILTPTGDQSFAWSTLAPSTDFSQPFTLSGTSLGRVEVPVNVVGNGCDMLVSLYADLAGAPNIAAGAIVSTKVPAAYLNQVAAPLGLATSPPALATPRDNTLFMTGGATVTPWIVPSGNAAGDTFFNSFASNGSWIISTGGINSISTAVVASVWTAQYLGNGILGLPQAQPPLPQAVSGQTTCVANGDTLVVTGGNTSPSGFVMTGAVWTASWDSTTGIIGSWSAQTSLPVAIGIAGSAAWNNFVYIVGGSQENTSPATPLNTVRLGILSNGQITAWISMTPLPVPLFQPMVAAVNGWLLVGGGVTLVGGIPQPVSTLYYAQIAADGSLGAWQNGPTLPTLEFSQADGTFIVGDNFVGIGNGNDGGFSILAIDPVGGPGPNWHTTGISLVDTGPVVTVATGNGNYDVLTINFNTPVTTWKSSLTPVPVVSVPLGATGLTNGGAYHIVLRQFNSVSASDHLQFGTFTNSPVPGTALTNNHWGITGWTALPAGTGLPISLFSGLVNGRVFHMVCEPSTNDFSSTNQRWETFLYNSQRLLTGNLSVTEETNRTLNSNPTFTSGVSPWTPTNGVLTQSNAQTQGGFPFSALLTPTGGFSSAYTISERIPITQTQYGAAQWVLVDGFFYSPAGYANFLLQMNWYDSAANYLSTSFLGTTNLAAATWTQVFHYAQVPATAALGAINPVLANNPANTDLLYMSNVTIVLAPETVPALTSALQIAYNSTGYQPSMINQLV